MNKISSKAKIVAMTSLTLATLFSAFVASFAWFSLIQPNTDVVLAAGNLEVNLYRLSAYRYVYPFFEGTSTYIDYSKEGKVKETVLMDASDDSEKTLPETETTSEATDSLYLVGDDRFLGYDGSDFSTSDGLKFQRSIDGMSYEIHDFTLSSGSVFAVKNSDGENLSLSLDEDGKIKELGNGYFKAEEAGIYDFKIQKKEDGSSSFSVSGKEREDNAILGMTLFDPTYALLEGKEGAQAIYSQNTCLIFDVTLEVKNQGHAFSIESQVRRQETTYRYPLSDYITYRSVSSLPEGKTPYEYFHPDDDEEADASGYNKSEDVVRFQDEKDQVQLYKESIASDTEKTYIRTYIAIDYDPDKIKTFFEESNLGRSFDLPRDFTFFFYVQQTVKDGGQGK